MSRLLRAGLAAVIALLAAAAPALADIRTGSAPPKYPSPEESSPTRPEMARASIRYDDQAGTLEVTISLVDALADPAATSALRPWRFYVGLGDYLNGICIGEGNSGLLLTGSLTDPAQAVLDAWPDFDNTYDAVAVTQTLSADRTQVQLSVTDPRLVGLNLICADATIRDTRESSSASSHTFAFLMDGYDAADGALAREIGDHLWRETDTVAVRLRPGKGRSAVKITCRELYRAMFSCRGSGPLRGARGGVRLTLRGRMRFDARGARKLGGAAQHGWHAESVRVTVSWKRCPPDTRPKKLRGKPCHISSRWNGTRYLADALGV